LALVIFYFFFKFTRFPNIIALSIVIVAEKNAGFQHVVDFLLFLCAK